MIFRFSAWLKRHLFSDFENNNQLSRDARCERWNWLLKFDWFSGIEILIRDFSNKIQSQANHRHPISLECLFSNDYNQFLKWDEVVKSSFFSWLVDRQYFVEGFCYLRKQNRFLFSLLLFFAAIWARTVHMLFAFTDLIIFKKKIKALQIERVWRKNNETQNTNISQFIE